MQFYSPDISSLIIFLLAYLVTQYSGDSITPLAKMKPRAAEASTVSRGVPVTILELILPRSKLSEGGKVLLSCSELLYTGDNDSLVK
ncbi:hypothetical protein E2C01_059744 [Portunus trituberculatus]|uniref:Uncharacterized protein n=1 Tax=Portunus trituberculatus TaxID=210409 RepID=A0A5B7H6N7_PORTR|nr:hypothetical protein [Portunus trituberculatus]